MEISCRDLPFVELKLENCELTCNHTTQLLGVLPTLKTPLNMLSIKGQSISFCCTVNRRWCFPSAVNWKSGC
ncbi:hypothetical protein F511_42943 [Dorcoceras hygrometricum]|uniref:Uncharacterized protein n=1 Tax=Dorcoceras hygrometricum TaxID=472368 RepID=A0A2Z7ACM2_9LAMI|nr:hypothetical protein F511_42943 [Dorcoceras hygrometricum]